MVRISKYIVILVSLVEVIVLIITKFVSKFCLIYYKKIMGEGKVSNNSTINHNII